MFCTYVLQKRGGFDVTHIADPTVALTLAVTRPWDLVIADLDLPIMSGLEFVAALRRMARDLGRTGNSSQKLARRQASAGASAHW